MLNNFLHLIISNPSINFINRGKKVAFHTLLKSFKLKNPNPNPSFLKYFYPNKPKMTVLIMSTNCSSLPERKREINHKVISNYLVYMRQPLQTNQTLQEVGACWHTKIAFLDFSSTSFLQSQPI